MIPVLDTHSADFLATRFWLQDITKVMGKFQQVFLPKHPLDWQTGLLVSPNLITTQQLKIADHTSLLMFRPDSEELVLDDQNWSLKDLSASQLSDALNDWLKDQQQPAMAQPELKNQTEHDPDVARNLVELLYWAAQALETHKVNTVSKDCSPVLLYPHHFDESFSWYPKGMTNAKNTDDQRAYGFSLGDEYINAPYFYVTAYPEPADFAKQTLPPEAHWQTEKFSGAVLPYEAAVKSDQAQVLVQQFLQSVR